MDKLFEKYNKYNAQLKSTKVSIFCRICYAHIWEPKGFNGGDPKYSVSCLIDKEDTKTIELVKKAIHEAEELGKTKCWGGKIPSGSSYKYPLRDGDIDRNGDASYVGQMFVNASSAEAPEIVGPKRNLITDPMEVGSGDYCFVAINFYPFNAGGVSKGVAAGLSNIQLATHGKRLSGKTSALQDFGELPDDDENGGVDELPGFLA